MNDLEGIQSVGTLGRNYLDPNSPTLAHIVLDVHHQSGCNLRDSEVTCHPGSKGSSEYEVSK